MTGHDYEYVVANYLRRHGYSGVTVTQGSGDYGVDVVAKKAGVRYAIQCKHYSKPVGQEAVREAVAGMAMYRCQRAMVVTNSTFTRAAEDLARINGVILLSGIESERSQTGAGWLLRIVGVLFWALFAWLAFCFVRDNIQNGEYLLAIRNTIESVLLLSARWWLRALWRRLKKQQATRKAKQFEIVEPTVRKTALETADYCSQPQHRLLLPEKQIVEALRKLKNDSPDAFNLLFATLDYLQDDDLAISTNAMQRRLRCDYARASKAMEDIEAVGLVSPFNGSMPRTLYASKQQLFEAVRFVHEA